MNQISKYQNLLNFISFANHATTCQFASELPYHSLHCSYFISPARKLDPQCLSLLVSLQNTLSDHLYTLSLNQFCPVYSLKLTSYQDNHFSIKFMHFYHRPLIFFRRPFKLIPINLHKLFVDFAHPMYLEKQDHLTNSNFLLFLICFSFLFLKKFQKINRKALKCKTVFILSYNL